MLKLRYVIEVDVPRVPHELDKDGKPVVSSKGGQALLEVLYKSDMSFDARNKLEHTTGVTIKAVEVMDRL